MVTRPTVGWSMNLYLAVAYMSWIWLCVLSLGDAVKYASKCYYPWGYFVSSLVCFCRFDLQPLTHGFQNRLHLFNVSSLACCKLVIIMIVFQLLLGWTNSLLCTVCLAMGNERVNSYWEAELPPNYDRVGIENFIRAKYVYFYNSIISKFSQSF